MVYCANHTFQPTDLVGEAYRALAARNRAWKGRTHFKANAAIQMRRLLVDYARRRKAAGGRLLRVTLSEGSGSSETSADLVMLNQALDTGILELEVQGSEGDVRKLWLDLADTKHLLGEGDLLEKIGLKPWRPRIDPARRSHSIHAG